MLDKMQLFGKPNQPQPAPRPDAAAAPRKPADAAPPPAPARPDAAPAVAPRPEPGEGSRLTVGPGVKLKGAEIADCGMLVVEGRVEAVLDSQAIQIAEAGAFSGRVVIDNAEIFGHFDGDLLARKRLVVHATGRVSGKIRYGKIVIEEGGEVSGDVCSLAAEQVASPPAPVSALASPANDEARRPERLSLDAALARPRPAVFAK